MRVILKIILLIGAFWLAQQIWNTYKSVSRQDSPSSTPGTSQANQSNLPGLPECLEFSLATAKREGPVSLKKWLQIYKAQISDPRLADIELDYAVSISRQNYQEACEIFKKVKSRTPTNSPVYPRVLQLSHVFENSN
jgi:hypothetical protein